MGSYAHEVSPTWLLKEDKGNEDGYDNHANSNGRANMEERKLMRPQP